MPVDCQAQNVAPFSCEHYTSKANFSVSKKADIQLFLLQNNKLQNDVNENVTFTAFQKPTKKQRPACTIQTERRCIATAKGLADCVKEPTTIF